MHEPAHAEARAIATVWRRISASCSGPSESGGITQAESPECTPASSTCCITPPISTVSPSRDRVDVDLDRVLEEAVDERVRRHGQRADVVRAVADAHRAAAEHVRRAHEHRVADALGDRDGLVDVARDRPLRRSQPELGEQAAEALAVLGEVDRGRVVPRIGTPSSTSVRARRERRLTAELRDDPERLLALDDREHVLDRERLEVQPVRDVVVGRDGLGVAVDHDRLAARAPERAHRLHAAVVELDALADAVRARAEDQHADASPGSSGSSTRS